MSHGIYALEPDVNTLSQLSVVNMPAQTNRVGGIMPGNGLVIDTAGVLSVKPVSSISVNGTLIGMATNAPLTINGVAMP